MRNWRRTPFTLVLLIVWGALRACGIPIVYNSVMGVSLIAVSLVLLVVEFYKAGDIGHTTFKIEQATSMLAFGGFMWMAGRFVPFNAIHLGDIIVGAVLAVDAWLPGCTAFGMALRNIQGNVGHDSNPQGE